MWQSDIPEHNFWLEGTSIIGTGMAYYKRVKNSKHAVFAMRWYSLVQNILAFLHLAKFETWSKSSRTFQYLKHSVYSFLLTSLLFFVGDPRFAASLLKTATRVHYIFMKVKVVILWEQAIRLCHHSIHQSLTDKGLCNSEATRTFINQRFFEIDTINVLTSPWLPSTEERVANWSLPKRCYPPIQLLCFFNLCYKICFHVC